MEIEVLVSGRVLEIQDDLLLLPVVKLDRETDSDVNALGADAARDQHVDYPYRYVHFVTPPFQNEGGRRYQAPYPPGFVAADGALWWPNRGAEGVTLGDLERTSTAGLLGADPHALLIEVMAGGEGDFVADTWMELLTVLHALRDGTAAVAAIGVSVAALKSVIDSLHEAWEARGGSPRRVLTVTLRRREWRAAELAERLLMTPTEAALWLDALGYDLRDDDVYRVSEEPDRRLVRRQIRTKFLRSDPSLSDVEGFVELQRRLRTSYRDRSG